jgi:hypothetical protein
MNRLLIASYDRAIALDGQLADATRPVDSLFFICAKLLRLSTATIMHWRSILRTAQLCTTEASR